MAKAKAKAAPTKAASKAKKASPAKADKSAKAKSGKKVGQETEAVNRLIHLQPKMIIPENPRAAAAAFYAKKIDAVEAKTHLVSNVSKYCDPLSSGYLCIDWLFNGGFYNGFASVSGQEQAGKTTSLNHVVSNTIRQNLIFSSFIDAEGTMNDEYSTAMFALAGISYPELDNINPKIYRYYKDNVIETIFDYMHGLLKLLPQKVWIPDANSWAYLFDKRNKEEDAKMEAYGVKPDRNLSRNDKFVCLTENSGVEAGFFVDSFAAMVSEGDDDEERKSKRRAVEASAFSEHFRRITSRLSNRGVLLLGVNQLRKTPNVIGRQDPYYEPGGEALKFYSAQRARFTTKQSGFPGMAAYHKDLKAIAEPSVIVPGKYDIYDYKHIKNTKNKMGNPKKETWVRAWVADHNGQGHGFDPAFDVYNYLLTTGQLKKDGGRGKLMFNLRKSAGTKRAELLNSLPAFTEADLKTLTLSEVFPSRELTKKALDAMKLTKTVSLREALFDQVRNDKKIRAKNTSVKAKKEEDYEDDGAAEY